MHRIPTNEHLKQYMRGILNLMFQLIQIDNEENVLVCLRIIIELHKYYRPQFNNEVNRQIVDESVSWWFYDLYYYYY